MPRNRALELLKKTEGKGKAKEKKKDKDRKRTLLMTFSLSQGKAARRSRFTSEVGRALLLVGIAVGFRGQGTSAGGGY